MSIVNTRDKTITTKIVYYGPGLGGKTTSLMDVHRVLDPEHRAKLVSLKTDEERTLFFDFLPIDLGIVGGYKIKIQGFTVPGQVKYNLTRKYVLMGADAVVFVADSQSDRLHENVESVTNLAANLAANGLDLETIPLVMQYNKRDLPSLSSAADLERELNHRGAPWFATSAISGDGVFDAFAEATESMLDSVAARYRIPDSGEDGASVGQSVRAYLTRLAQRTSA